MSDENTGSGDDQAPQGGEGSAGDLLGGDASGDTGAQPNDNQQKAADQQQQQQAPAGAEGDPHWTSGFEGDDLGWLQNRGYHEKEVKEAVASLVKGFRSAEKRLGVPADRLIQLPEDRTSEGAMDDVFKALGRPDEASGYEISPEEGDSLSEGFVSTFTETAFGLGLSKDQAEGIYATLDKFFEDNYNREQEESAGARKEALEGLKAEWGDTYDFNVQLAKEAAQKTGAPIELLNLMGDLTGEAGHVKIIKFFNSLAQRSGAEDVFETGDDTLGGLGATTPEAAQQRINEMKADPKIRKLLLANNPDNAEVKRYNRLVTLAKFYFVAQSKVIYQAPHREQHH